MIDPLQHSFQRHARLLPSLHDRPIERRDQEIRAPLLPEIILNFREVVEVVPTVHMVCRRGATHEKYARGPVPGYSNSSPVLSSREPASPIGNALRGSPPLLYRHSPLDSFPKSA